MEHLHGFQTHLPQSHSQNMTPLQAGNTSTDAPTHTSHDESHGTTTTSCSNVNKNPERTTLLHCKIRKQETTIQGERHNVSAGLVSPSALAVLRPERSRLPSQKNRPLSEMPPGTPSSRALALASPAACDSEKCALRLKSMGMTNGDTACELVIQITTWESQRRIWQLSCRQAGMMVHGFHDSGMSCARPHRTDHRMRMSERV